MHNKKLYISLGISVLLIGISVFVAGRLITGASTREDLVSHVTPAPEIPTTTPEITGLFVENKDNTVIVQTVSFDAGPRGVAGNAPG